MQFAWTNKAKLVVPSYLHMVQPVVESAPLDTVVASTEAPLAAEVVQESVVSTESLPVVESAPSTEAPLAAEVVQESVETTESLPVEEVSQEVVLPTA